MIDAILCALRALPGHCRKQFRSLSFPGARAILFFCLLLVGLVALHRPYLPQLLPSYRAFDDFMPFTLWGWSSVTLSVLMVCTRPGTLPALATNFLVSVLLFALFFAFTASAGVVFSSAVFFVLAWASLLLFAMDFRGWFPKIGWVQHLSNNPPEVIRRWFDDRR